MKLLLQPTTTQQEVATSSPLPSYGSLDPSPPPAFPGKVEEIKGRIFVRQSRSRSKFGWDFLPSTLGRGSSLRLMDDGIRLKGCARPAASRDAGFPSQAPMKSAAPTMCCREVIGSGLLVRCNAYFHLVKNMFYFPLVVLKGICHYWKYIFLRGT